MRRQVIFDCDPGHDDALALLLALSSDELEVKVITTGAGNQTQDKTLLNTLKLLSFIGVNHIEVARGAEKPLLRELLIADNIHGESGLDGADLGDLKIEESSRSALEAMRGVIESTEEKITIIATGPLTNIATLLLSYPKFKEKIECISLMGGAAFGGNCTPAAEFNIYVDPEAADIVFSSGIPIIMSGLDVTHKAAIYREEIHSIRKIGNSTSQVIASLLDFFSENSPPYYLSKDVHIKTAHMHDACAVAYIIDPTMFEGIDCYVEVETAGKITTGSTVVDINRRSGKPANAKVLFDIDRERLIEMLYSAITYFR